MFYIFQEIPNANIDMNVFSNDLQASMQYLVDMNM
jgi:hypothetical protein